MKMSANYSNYGDNVFLRQAGDPSVPEIIEGLIIQLIQWIKIEN